MFAQEGRRKKYDKDPQVIKMVNWIKNEQLRKALYRTNVEEKIEITEHDLLQAFYKNNLQLHVRHLFAKTKEEIVSIQKDNEIRDLELDKQEYTQRVLIFAIIFILN